ASRSLHSEYEYAEFGEPHDRRFLESIRDRSTLTIVHCHGDQLMFERLARLPGHAWNWDDRATPPSLGEGRALVPGAVIGGLNQWKTLRDGTPEQSVAEVDDGIGQTGGRGVIIGAGVVQPSKTADPNAAAGVGRSRGGLTWLLVSSCGSAVL